MSEVRRKRGESFEGFMRRVKRQWLHSGRLLQAKKVQFYQPKKSKNEQRKQTVAKVKLKVRQTYLRKIGKLPEEEERSQTGSWRPRK